MNNTKPLFCTAPNCVNPVRYKALCNTHLMRLRRIGSFDLPPREKQPCSIEGCDRPR